MTAMAMLLPRYHCIAMKAMLVSGVEIASMICLAWLGLACHSSFGCRKYLQGRDGQREMHWSLAAAHSVDLPTDCNVSGACKLVGIEWYDGSHGYAETNCPVLALCLDNGRMQLMRHDVDDSAVCIDTGIKPKAIKWNHNGSVSCTFPQRQAIILTCYRIQSLFGLVSHVVCPHQASETEGVILLHQCTLNWPDHCC